MKHWLLSFMWLIAAINGQGSKKARIDPPLQPTDQRCPPNPPQQPMRANPPFNVPHQPQRIPMVLRVSGQGGVMRPVAGQGVMRPVAGQGVMRPVAGQGVMRPVAGQGVMRPVGGNQYIEPRQQFPNSMPVTERLRITIAELEANIRFLSEQNDVLREENNEYRSLANVKKAADELKSVRALNTQLNSRVRCLLDQNKVLRDKNDELQKLADEKEARDQTVDVLIEKNLELQQLADANLLKDQLNYARELNTQLEDTVRTLQGNLCTTEDDKAKLVTKVASLTAQLSATHRAQSAAQEQILAQHHNRQVIAYNKIYEEWNPSDQERSSSPRINAKKLVHFYDSSDFEEDYIRSIPSYPVPPMRITSLKLNTGISDSLAAVMMPGGLESYDPTAGRLLLKRVIKEFYYPTAYKQSYGVFDLDLDSKDDSHSPFHFFIHGLAYTGQGDSSSRLQCHMVELSNYLKGVVKTKGEYADWIKEIAGSVRKGGTVTTISLPYLLGSAGVQVIEDAVIKSVGLEILGNKIRGEDQNYFLRDDMEILGTFVLTEYYAIYRDVIKPTSRVLPKS